MKWSTRTLRRVSGSENKEKGCGVLKISGKQGSEGCVLPTYHHTEVVMCNYSYHSYKKKNDLFAYMFLDSKIAFQFHHGKTKCACTILYGIAPYVFDVLNDALQEVPVYSLSLMMKLTTVCQKSYKLTFDSFDSLLGWECWNGQHMVLWVFRQSCSHWCF